MDKHKKLLDAAQEAVREVFCDSAVSMERTVKSLKEIKEQVDGYLSTFEEED